MHIDRLRKPLALREQTASFMIGARHIRRVVIASAAKQSGAGATSWIASP